MRVGFERCDLLLLVVGLVFPTVAQLFDMIMFYFSHRAVTSQLNLHRLIRALHQSEAPGKKPCVTAAINIEGRMKPSPEGMTRNDEEDAIGSEPIRSIGAKVFLNITAQDLAALQLNLIPTGQSRQMLFHLLKSRKHRAAFAEAEESLLFGEQELKR